jgi:hypothetical protein
MQIHYQCIVVHVRKTARLMHSLLLPIVHYNEIPQSVFPKAHPQRQHPQNTPPTATPPKGQKTPKKGKKPQKPQKPQKPSKTPKKGQKWRFLAVPRFNNWSKMVKNGTFWHPPVGTGKNTLLQSLPDIKKSLWGVFPSLQNQNTPKRG